MPWRAALWEAADSSYKQHRPQASRGLANSIGLKSGPAAIYHQKADTLRRPFGRFLQSRPKRHLCKITPAGTLPQRFTCPAMAALLRLLWEDTRGMPAMAPPEPKTGLTSAPRPSSEASKMKPGQLKASPTCLGDTRQPVGFHVSCGTSSHPPRAWASQHQGTS